MSTGEQLVAAAAAAVLLVVLVVLLVRARHRAPRSVAPRSGLLILVIVVRRLRR